MSDGIPVGRGFVGTDLERQLSVIAGLDYSCCEQLGLGAGSRMDRGCHAGGRPVRRPGPGRPAAVEATDGWGHRAGWNALLAARGFGVNLAHLVGMKALG